MLIIIGFLMENNSLNSCIKKIEKWGIIIILEKFLIIMEPSALKMMFLVNQFILSLLYFIESKVILTFLFMTSPLTRFFFLQRIMILLLQSSLIMVSNLFFLIEQIKPLDLWIHINFFLKILSTLWVFPLLRTYNRFSLSLSFLIISGNWSH